MSVTDELRKMLDERGVESWDMQTRGLWFGITGNDHKYEAHEQRDGLLLVEAMSLTPEQAIAATLGSEFNPDGLPVGLTISDDSNLLNWRGENYVKQSTLGSGRLTAEQVCEIVDRHWHDLPTERDMPEATALPEYSYDWQAIADELNARAERTCEIVEWYEARDRHEIGNNRVKFSCNHIGTCHYKFCAECGARVVERIDR